MVIAAQNIKLTQSQDWAITIWTDLLVFVVGFSHPVMSSSLWPHGLQPTRLRVHGISQARVLEWVAISSSRGASQTRDGTHFPASLLHCKWILCHWTIEEALLFSELSGLVHCLLLTPFFGDYIPYLWRLQNWWPSCYVFPCCSLVHVTQVSFWHQLLSSYLFILSNIYSMQSLLSQLYARYKF